MDTMPLGFEIIMAYWGFIDILIIDILSMKLLIITMEINKLSGEKKKLHLKQTH